MGKIEMIVKKKIGKSTFTFMLSAENFHDVVRESTKLSFGDIDKCGCCGSDNLTLSAHETKDDGYKFTYVKCIACKSTLNFGQQKKDTAIVYYRMKEDGNGNKILNNGRPEYDWRKPEPKESK
jgi:hypothetical protein